MTRHRSAGTDGPAAGSVPAVTVTSARHEGIYGGRRPARSMLLFLSMAALSWQVGFGIYRSIYNNFVVEVYGVRADQLGVIESLREVPGLLTVLLVALVAGLAPSLVSGLCCILMGVGLALYPLAGGVLDLVVITVLFSTGFHALFPAQSTLVLHHAGEGQRGRWLGVMDSVGAAAALLAMAAAALFVTRVGFSGLFVAAAASMFAGAVVFLCLPGPPRLSVGRRLVNLRPDYLTYYVMTLLQGARRHFFLVFALFNLVDVHGVKASTIALLLGISGAASIVTRPVIGRLADRLGPARVLTWCFGLVSLVFVGYAFARSLGLLYALYVLDSVLTFELVITLYAYTVAKGPELGSALASGSTVGHITGVLVPVSGGLLWKAAGPMVTFLCGASICLFGAGFSAWVCRRAARRGTQGLAGSETITMPSG